MKNNSIFFIFLLIIVSLNIKIHAQKIINLSEYKDSITGWIYLLDNGFI